MNSEDKIYSKIKSASHKCEKDFPGMDKVWNRVEEKLDNTIVVKKKNTWQKLAIAAIVLLSFSIIYQFVSNDEIIKDKVITNDSENPVIVSNDSVEKIIEKAKEVVVDNNTSKTKKNKINPYYNSGIASEESNFFPNAIIASEVDMDDSAVKMELKEDQFDSEEKDKIVTELNKNLNTENEISFRNSALNFSSSNANNGYLAPTKKYDVATKVPKSKYKSPKSEVPQAQAKASEDIVLVDGVVVDKKELNNLNTEDIDSVSRLSNPLYIINGIQYTEESLFGKNPTSPYAPLDKQKITSLNIIKALDATKIYGKKGENGIVIITTKDGKPVDK